MYEENHKLSGAFIMAKGKRKTSLVANLIIMIGLGIMALTVLQVAVLSQLAKNDSRNDHVESYVMLTTSLKMNIEKVIDLLPEEV